MLRRRRAPGAGAADDRERDARRGRGTEHAIQVRRTIRHRGRSGAAATDHAVSRRRDRDDQVPDRAGAGGAGTQRNGAAPCIYAERAAKVSKLGEPTDLMRRYDWVDAQGSGAAHVPLNPPLLQGLTIWYHRRPPLRPQIIEPDPRSHAPRRRVRHDRRGREHAPIDRRSSRRFPSAWARPGTIPRAAVQNVSGQVARRRKAFEMTGTLLKVSRSKDGKSLRRRDRHRGRIRRRMPDPAHSTPGSISSSCLGASHFPRRRERKEPSKVVEAAGLDQAGPAVARRLPAASRTATAA